MRKYLVLETPSRLREGRALGEQMLAGVGENAFSAIHRCLEQAKGNVLYANPEAAEHSDEFSVD